ncbi:hypothetical protein [Actinomadura sp. HBU206391]|uniref:hypothetical protein n=1 Tax=Actinomadura sp. HBU206391 TaxID=2731692 RepID=UPI00164F0C02|nr:hypothetical protein [Actinomadura sp. HBU206391]
MSIGCCPVPETATAGGAKRYRLHGEEFKGTRAESEGAAPEPIKRSWTVLPVVHTAVAILEQLTTIEFLFPVRPYWLSSAANGRHRTSSAKASETATGRGAHGHGRRRRTGAVITAKTANQRIAQFILWVNDFAQRNDMAGEMIPADPDGPVIMRRFRRTLAWHIARLPGGRLALAVQYGHLRPWASTVTDGYSSRARHGLRRVLDVETARAMADYLTDLAERLEQGKACPVPLRAACWRPPATQPRVSRECS